MAVKPGDILRDTYRIDALIGRGGMGQVFAATDLSSDARAQVAIKVVSRLLVDDVMMMRLHREAVAAQRIQSDFVPRVLHVDDTDDGETFLVMERLVGEPLSQRIRDNGALPWSEVVRIGEDILRGLIDAHEAGIIHRDLKPSNVFLALKAGRLRAMILDFGVCKMDGVDAERLTGTGESIGTVAYMAPEQIRGAARVDERADLYAFGVVVFEMLCGRLPHEGPSQMAILASKLENRPARLREHARVALPDGLEELVLRTLDREASGRPDSAEELLRLWRDLAKSAQPADRYRSSGDEFDATAGGDAPTEVSARILPAVSAWPSKSGAPPPGPSYLDDLPPPITDEVTRVDGAVDEAATFEDLGAASREAELLAARPPSILPLEPHPTETTLITQTPAGGTRPSRSSRIAIALGVAALFGSAAIVALVVLRTPNAPAAAAAAPPPPPPPPRAVAPPPPAAADEAPPAESLPPAAVAPSAEPVDDTPAEPKPKAPPRPHPAPKPARTAAPAPAPPSPPAPRPPTGPRITPQPRY